MAVEVNPNTALQKFRSQHETLGDAADALGVSKQYLSDMLQGRRDLSPRILAKLGLKRAVIQDRG